MARRHIAYYEATDTDLMKVMNDTGYAPIGTLSIDGPQDWLALEPTPLSDPLFQSHIDGLKRIVDAIGQEVLIMTTAFNPYNQAVAIIRENPSASRKISSDDARAIFWQQVRTDPEPVSRGLQVIAEDLGRYYVACVRDAGINGIYYSAQGGERALCSDEEHARFLKPVDLHVLEAVGQAAEFVVGHFCGKSVNLGRFVDYPIQLANWAHQSDNLSLTDGKALFGGISVLGGLDERGPLVYGPREALRSEIERSLEEMGTRGFMLGAGCTVPGDTDESNLRYARQVVGELTA